MRSKVFLTMVLIFGLSTVGCDKTRDFAVNVDRVAGYLDTAGALVASQVESGTISKETGVRVVETLQQVNRLNGELITEGRNYLAPDGSLRLTGDGQARLMAIVVSARRVISARLADPAFTSLEESKRAEITKNLRQVETILALLGETIKTAKLVKGGTR